MSNPEETDGTLYYAIYNPNIKNVSLINFQRETPHLSISVWSVMQKDFLPVYAEAFCFKSPELKSLNECDIYVNHTLKALTLTILRIAKNPKLDISIKAKKTAWISNQVLNLTV